MKTDNSDTRHGFSRSVAKEHGVNAAIVFRYISYRINHSKNLKEGKIWYYDSVEKIAEVFPYLGKSAVYEAINKLKGKDGPLIVGNYNRKGYDRTTWYAFKNKAASQSAEKDVIYFKVEDALNLSDVAKAVLLLNLRYHITEGRKSKPGYCLHPMSPTELADILPFSRASIQRKLKALVDEHFELVSVHHLDGREPKQYGFRDEVEFWEDGQTFRLKRCQIPGQSGEQPPQPQKCNIASSNAGLHDSSTNLGGSKANDNTTLIDNPLKDPFERDSLKVASLLRRDTSFLPLSQISKKHSQERIEFLNQTFSRFSHYIAGSKTQSSLPVHRAERLNVAGNHSVTEQAVPKNDKANEVQATMDAQNLCVASSIGSPN